MQLNENGPGFERGCQRQVVIPDHKLLRLISRGSYGEVWLAQNSLGTFRAVKIVFPGTFRDKRPLEREWSGIKHFEPVSRLHPNLVDVLQVGRSDEAGYFYCVMELADDASGAKTIDPETYKPRTLARELAHLKRLSIDACVDLGIAMVSALGFLLERGLIHRDVKPSNIIFISGVPRLADIGLVADLSEARSYVGTQGFIPPEGPGTVQSDLYSLGKVLYEISTGRDRNDYPSLPTFLGAEEQDARTLGLNNVILKACRNDPKDRYRSAQAMRNDLLAVRRGQGVSSHRPVPLTTVAALGVVLILCALGAFGIAHRRRSPPGSPPQPGAEWLHAPPPIPGLVALWRGDSAGLDLLHPEVKPALSRVETVQVERGAVLSIGANKGFIEVPDAAFLRITNELTVEFWVKRQQLAAADFIIEKGGDWIDEDLDYSVAINSENDGNYLMFGFSCGSRLGGIISDFAWHHCAVVAREGEADPEIYVDGCRQPIFYRRGNDRIHLSPSTKPLHIGAQVDLRNGTDYFSPKLLAMVALYNRALTMPEIQMLASGCGEAAMLSGSSNPQSVPAKPIREKLPSAPPGLVGWWRAEGDATDEVGTNNAVLVGGARFGPGKFGKGFLLNGDHSYVRIPASASLNLSPEFTVELWFRNESKVPYIYGLVAKRGSEEGPVNYDLSVGPRGISVAYNDPNTPGGDDPLSAFECSIYPVWPEPLVWHHLAGTFRQVRTNQVEIKTFLDGSLVRTRVLPGSLAASINNYPVTIGADAEYPTYDFFEGTIDEVRLYSRALQDREIGVIYEQAKRSGIAAALESDTNK